MQILMYSNKKIFLAIFETKAIALVPKVVKIFFLLELYFSEA